MDNSAVEIGDEAFYDTAADNGLFNTKFFCKRCAKKLYPSTDERPESNVIQFPGASK